MTAIQGDRFGIYTWTQDSDEFTRVQMNTSHDAIEDYSAKFFTGSSAPPSPGTEIHVGAVYYRTSNAVLYWYTGLLDLGTGVFTAGTWLPLNEYGVVGDIQSITAGGSSSAGVSSSIARADHTHALSASTTPSSISTTAAVGTSSQVARADHVHVLSSGSINSSAFFTAGIVDESAIGSAAVTSAKIKSSGSVDADRTIESNHIKNDAVVERTINSAAVSKDKIASDSIVKVKVHTGVAGGPGVYFNATASGGGAITYGTAAVSGSANDGDIYLRYI